jgi:hypothetical protein
VWSVTRSALGRSAAGGVHPLPVVLMSAAFVPPAMPHHLPRPLAALALTAALAAPPRSVDAQSVVSSVDIGGAGMKWGDSLTTTRTVAGSIAPAVRLDWARATLGASGSWSHLGPGWSSQGLLVGSVFTPSLGPLSLELAGNLAGSLHSDETRAAQTLGLGRLHLMASRGGLWAGGGPGTVWDGVAGWSQLKVAEGGLWGRIGRLTALVSASPTWIEDAEPFTDGELAIRIPGDRYEFGAAVGARFGTIPPGVLDDTKQWGSASLLVRLPGRVSLVAAAGTYPADLAQRFPGGQFASLGLRLGGWRNQSSPTGDRDAWRTTVPDERTRAAE